jgi:glutathione S-transferase
MTKQKIDQQPKLKLYYFNIKGKAEAIRLFCAYAGLELEDYRFSSRDEFHALKQDGTLAFGQVPLLQVDGKHQLVQSGAILRYLAQIAGLYPSDPLLAAKVDACMAQVGDAFYGSTAVTYNTRFGIPMDDELKKKAMETISSDILPTHLKNLERLLTTSSTGWLAGTEEPSPADFMWYSSFVHYMAAATEVFPEKLCKLEDYPLLQAFCDKVGSLEAIKEYYAKK